MRWKCADIENKLRSKTPYLFGIFLYLFAVMGFPYLAGLEGQNYKSYLFAAHIVPVFLAVFVFFLYYLVGWLTGEKSVCKENRR